MKISSFKFSLRGPNWQVSRIIPLVIILLLMIGISLFAFWRYNKTKEAAIILEVPKTLVVNKETVVPVKIDTAGSSVNAAEVYLKFDPAELEVISVSKENSFFALWVTDSPAFSSEKGEISLAGGLPTPGFKGKGQIGSIKIKAKKKGNITIEFDKKSRALLNDGAGTEIKLKLDSIKIKAEG